MSTSTLGLGGGAYLGIGLRQSTEISDPDITGINTYNGIGIVFFSPSGERVASLTAGRGEGEKLEAKMNFMKYGNLQSFVIEMLRNNEIPFFNGMKVQFYYQNLSFAYGYVDGFPTSDQISSIVKISGKGYVTKLKDKKISVNYTNKTIEYILDDLGSTYFLDLGFNYNSSKIQPPNTTISSVDWSEKDLLKIIQDLISISNESFDTVEYIFGIDKENDFYFKGISQSEIVNAYFEGYNYQNPNVEDDASNLVNRVQLYRTQSGSDKDTEYVNTYSDSDSIDQYGLYERKVTFSDFIDNTTAQNAANGIIASLKDPKIRLIVNNLIIDSILNYGYYSLNNKKQDQKTVISDFALSSEWTTSLTTSTITIRDENVYTGRLCYQWDIDNSEDDYITKEVEYYLPTKLKLFVRQDIAGEYLSISITGTKRKIIENFATDEDNQIGTDTDARITRIIEDTSLNDSVNINVPFANDWTEIELDLVGWIKITDITITVIDPTDITILLDRLEIYTNTYVQRLLSLENVNYVIGESSVKCNQATFGTDKILLTEELKKIFCS
jgi:hypothetical protein